MTNSLVGTEYYYYYYIPLFPLITRARAPKYSLDRGRQFQNLKATASTHDIRE